MNTDMQLFAVLLLLAIIDILVGLIKSKILKTYKSSIMRKGYINKMSTLGIALFVVLIKYLSNKISLDVNIIETFKLAEFSFTYLIINEIGSIYENLKQIKDKTKIDGK